MKLGADDFIIKPVVPLVMNSRISRILELKELRDELETQLDKKTKQVKMVTLNSIMSIANTIDAKDKYTSGHSIRVANCAVEIAKKLGWSESEIQNFRYVALLHDIGKIGVPDSVLNKPEKLTDEEFAIIKEHPVTGGEILKDIRIIEHVQEGALFHHERFDGKGYPFGLKGIDIPLYASSLKNAIDALKTSVITSLRASDVGTKYSSSQYIVILMDTNLDNGRKVAQRVVEKFHNIYTDSDSILTYDIQAMQPQIISKDKKDYV